MISLSDYNSIMREYDELQRQDRAARDARVEEVYERVPEIRELDESRGTVALALVRERKNDDITSAFASIRKQKEDLLKKAGFPVDYMEMKYTCPDCQDTGYSLGRKCHCLIARESKVLYAQSNIQNVLCKENFDMLDESVYSDREHMSKVVRYCRKFADEFGTGTGKKNILFTGNTGTGKTFLCNCIAKELMEKHYSVIYLSAIEMFDVMAQARIHHTEDEMLNELYERLFECDVLVIDDLGSELTNSLTNSNLFFLINHRMQGDKTTIISTNLSINTLRDVYTERVTSRIINAYDIIPVIGDDIRLNNR